MSKSRILFHSLPLFSHQPFVKETIAQPEITDPVRPHFFTDSIRTESIPEVNFLLMAMIAMTNLVFTLSGYLGSFGKP